MSTTSKAHPTLRTYGVDLMMGEITVDMRTVEARNAREACKDAMTLWEMRGFAGGDLAYNAPYHIRAYGRDTAFIAVEPK